MGSQDLLVAELIIFLAKKYRRHLKDFVFSDGRRRHMATM
jgi:hypothetical protein